LSRLLVAPVEGPGLQKSTTAELAFMQLGGLEAFVAS